MSTLPTIQEFKLTVELMTQYYNEPCNKLIYLIALRLIEVIKDNKLPFNLNNFSDDDLKFLEKNIERIKEKIENNSSLAARATFVSIYSLQQQVDKLTHENFLLKDKVNNLENQLAASSSGTENSSCMEESRKRKRDDDSKQVKITRFFNPPSSKNKNQEIQQHRDEEKDRYFMESVDSMHNSK